MIRLRNGTWELMSIISRVSYKLNERPAVLLKKTQTRRQNKVYFPFSYVRTVDNEIFNVLAS